MHSVAVIGAGLSGLIAARILKEHGCQVTVFEKSRGFGGRMATRRANPDIPFDHGAQYFTVRDEAFQHYVTSWIKRGVAAQWNGRIVQLGKGECRDVDASTQRFVGVPGMSAIGRDMAVDLTVRLETRIRQVNREGKVWTLADFEDRTHGPFDRLVVAVPSSQAAELLPDHPFAEKARRVQMTPCWAALIALPITLDVPWDGAFVNDERLAWIARNSSKPGRNGNPDCWVLHASPSWSLQNLEASREEVIQQLLASFEVLVRRKTGIPLYADVHRWMYSAIPEPLNDLAWHDPKLGLCLCGDWLAGARVEGAFRSGVAAADCVLRT
jgi:renalase